MTKRRPSVEFDSRAPTLETPATLPPAELTLFQRLTQVLIPTVDPEAKCSWCHKRQGGEVAPVPLCERCYTQAYEAANPHTAKADGGAAWTRLCTEFSKEMHQRMRALGSARYTSFDVLQDGHEASGSLAEIGRQIDEALKRKDVAEADRLSRLMDARMEAIREFRTTASQVVAALEKADHEE